MSEKKNYPICIGPVGTKLAKLFSKLIEKEIKKKNE